MTILMAVVVAVAEVDVRTFADRHLVAEAAEMMTMKRSTTTVAAGGGRPQVVQRPRIAGGRGPGALRETPVLVRLPS